MSKENNKIVSIQSKVTEATAKKIDAIVERGKFGSRYEFMQYLLSAFLKYADQGDQDDDEMSEELKDFAKMYEGWENKKNRIITTKPSGNRALRMTDSVNVYSELGRRGYVVRHISIHGDGQRISSNISSAVDTIIKKLHPRIANMLTEVGQTIGETQYIRVIEYLLEGMTIDRDRQTVQNTFKSNDGSNVYGIVPKRKRSKSINDEP